MGELVEMMEEGILCAGCGDLIAVPDPENPDMLKGVGYPSYCPGCQDELGITERLEQLNKIP